jgi:predicted phage terminase large subunit-like protein
MNNERKIADDVYRKSFGAFTYRAFEILNPGQKLIPSPHIDVVCYAIEQMVRGESSPKLVLNQPPGTLKSHIVSICLPAWILGKNPSVRIIAASYSEELARKFSRDTRALMETEFYKRVFRRTRLNPRKSAETEFETTQRGYRIATSIGGTVTGRRGDILIVDDPIKANDADSEVALTGANDWFQNSALSRLDSPASLVFVVMQRLHQRDLSGTLIEKGWPSLIFPAVAIETQTYLIGENKTYTRRKGELLQPERDTPEEMDAKRLDIGSRLWEAQYQQNPTPPEGNIIKAAWLRRYDFPPTERKFRQIVLSCDPAGKPGPHNDYTAIMICGFDDKDIYVLHVSRGHWTVRQMFNRIKMLAEEWNVDVIIIEDTSSGMGLIQTLREETTLSVTAQQPKGDKRARMSRHEGRFEAGHILLPKEAPWLADLERELLGFPNAKYDDQVDALVLSLDYFARAKRFEIPMTIGLPYVGPSSNSTDSDYPDYIPGFWLGQFR